MAHDNLIQKTSQLTYAAAAVAIEAAVARSRELAAPECIAVVDAGGNLLAFARVEGAAVLAREPAIAKATTSASLGMPTGSIPFEFGANLGLASKGALVNLGGGLPIVFRNTVLGAIGVGSGTTEQDVAVAESGRDALLKLLAAA
jgi:glc operon protein GlcG